MVFWVKVGAALLFLAAGCLAATLVLNAHVGFGWDQTTMWVADLFPSGLSFMLMLFGCSVLASHYSNGFLPALLFGAILTIAAVLGSIKLNLAEAFPFMQTVIGLSTLLLAYAVFVKCQTASLKRRVLFGVKGILLAAVCIYAALHGWNLYLTAHPGEHAIARLFETPHGLALQTMAIRKNVPNNLQVRPYLIPRGSAKAQWWQKRRNVEFETWSPDGKLVALIDHANHWGFYRHQDRLLICNQSGTVLFKGAWGYIDDVTWSPKEEKLAYVFRPIKKIFGPSRNPQLHVLESGSREPVMVPLKIDRWKRFSLLWWNDDGTALICEIYDIKEKINRLVAVSADGTKLTLSHPKPERDLNKISSSGRNLKVVRIEQGKKSSYLLWEDGALRPFLTFDENWSLEAMSPDTSSVLVSQWENLTPEHKRYNRKTRDWQMRISLALIHPDTRDPKITSENVFKPEESEIFLKKEYRNMKHFALHVQACWSDHDRVFYFITDYKDDFTTIYKLDPENPVPQSFLEFR